MSNTKKTADAAPPKYDTAKQDARNNAVGARAMDLHVEESDPINGVVSLRVRDMDSGEVILKWLCPVSADLMGPDAPTRADLVSASARGQLKLMAIMMGAHTATVVVEQVPPESEKH